MQPNKLLGPLRNKEDVTVATVNNNSTQHPDGQHTARGRSTGAFKTFGKKYTQLFFLNIKIHSK